MSKKLLLADDSITIQKVIGITFAHEDYALTIVNNGDAALSKARAERPDLILADVVMPGKNGYEVCTAVRQDSQLRHIPVLLLTGTFEPFDEGKAKAAGADSWIAKPFESQALIDRVEDLLSRAAAARLSEPEPEPVAAPPQEVATPAAADRWDELQGQETVAEKKAEPKDDLWAEPGAADDFWGAVSAEAAEEIEAPAVDDWSGLAVEVANAVGGTPPAQSQEGSIGEELEDMFTLEEAPTVAGDESFQFEELPDEGNVFAFEEIPAEEEEPFSPAPVTEPVAMTDSQWSDTATEWAGFEEEILPLDESDIIEEEDLPPVETASPSYAAGESYGLAADEEAFVQELPGGQSDEFVFGEATAEIGAPESADEFLFEEEGFALGGELPPIDEPEWGLPIEEDELSPPIARVVPEVSERSFGAGRGIGRASVPPEAAGVELGAASVEEKIAALSEEEIGRIVEKVAGPVIERLAQTLLEKVAWEVVPDLAESMIRDEIRKIRESAAR